MSTLIIMLCFLKVGLSVMIKVDIGFSNYYYYLLQDATCKLVLLMKAKSLDLDSETRINISLSYGL